VCIIIAVVVVVVVIAVGNESNVIKAVVIGYECVLIHVCVSE